MAPRLPRLSVLLLALAPVSAELDAQTDTAAMHEVGGETLRRAGATRASDLLVLTAPWHVSTVDGFTWQAAPPGASPADPTRVTVLVDGRRVESDLFGRLDLDRAGVPVERIGRVEFVDLPRLEAGRITTGGLVHIHTADPPRGSSAHGWLATGTEIGDPGPFAFTPAGGDNVDRLGHDLSVGASHGAVAWFAASALASTERIPTDPAIATRYLTAIGPRPRLEATTLSLDAGAGVGASRHHLSLRHVRTEGALGLLPLGPEVATRERVTQLGAAGTIALTAARALSYDLAHTVSRTRPRGTSQGPEVVWDAGTTEARLELARPRARLSTLGVRLRRVAAETREALARPTISLATAYGEITLGGAPASGLALAASLTAGDGEIGMAALGRGVWSVAAGATLEGVVAYERIARAANEDIWSWTERGYRLLQQAAAEYEVIGAPRAPERVAADLRWSWQAGRDLRVVARGLFRRERGLAIERARLHFVAEQEAFAGPVALVHGAGGELAGGRLELTMRAARVLLVGGSWWYSEPVGGDTLYREAQATMPRHGVRVTSEWVPVPGLELWLGAMWRSASRWAAYEAAEEETGGRYRSDLGAALTLDLAVAKRLWNGRLRAQAMVRNLLGAELRYHPAGATFAPTALVRVEARLP